jgi:uncharacterized membrane protein
MRARWLVAALVVSVALNLFLIGAAAGVVALGSRMAKENTARPGAFLIATQALPQPDRSQLRRAMGEFRSGLRDQADQSLALRSDAWAALDAAQPDVAAIKQKLQQSRQIDVAIRTQVEEKLVDDVAALSRADRATFAAGMRRALAPPPRPAHQAAPSQDPQS